MDKDNTSLCQEPDPSPRFKDMIERMDRDHERVMDEIKRRDERDPIYRLGRGIARLLGLD